MKKYLLFITIGSLFLGTQSYAMTSKVNDYKNFLQHKLITQGRDMYLVGYLSGPIRDYALNRRTQEIIDVAKKLHVNGKIAADLVTDVLLDGIVYYNTEQNPNFRMANKTFLKENVLDYVKRLVQNIFREF